MHIVCKEPFLVMSFFNGNFPSLYMCASKGISLSGLLAPPHEPKIFFPESSILSHPKFNHIVLISKISFEEFFIFTPTFSKSLSLIPM